MSRRSKWFTAAITVGLWGAWLATVAHAEIDPNMSVAWSVVSQALRTMVIVSSIVFALACMVSPALATARVWWDIGKREQQQQCDACPGPARRAAKLANLIPANFTGSVSRINSGRNRDF